MKRTTQDRLETARGGLLLVLVLCGVGLFVPTSWHAVVFSAAGVLAAFTLSVAWDPPEPEPPTLTRAEAEDLWGYIPEEWPPWRCPACGQRNARWALECGRCERGRTGDDHD